MYTSTRLRVIYIYVHTCVYTHEYIIYNIYIYIRFLHMCVITKCVHVSEKLGS